MKTFTRLFAAACLLLAAPLALAWGGLGHRMVGEIAQRHLTPAARAQVDALLAGEPDPSLGGIASWADAMRNDDPERFKRTSSWHYIKTTAECGYAPERDCPDGNCVVAQIQRQATLLGDRSQPLAARRDALKFLVHFVGDVHQPFHASNRDDKGGNGFQISLTTDIPPEAYARKNYVDGVMGTNLHSVWDYYILASRKLDADAYSALLDDGLPWPTPAKAIAPADAPAWAGESCRLIDARQLYPAQHKLDIGYLQAQRPLAEQRVRQAAYRLAALLNETLTD
ncbi:S1/P1 nuclease [Luteimonas aquatica]|uniref:S1/P1 nuclease n=1 Tax=Luteimonas aquatica TaxID=450364 RepID=UPI001F58DCD3|nr:S1/P1 nuclease [Luteimonas aquatica]